MYSVIYVYILCILYICILYIIYIYMYILCLYCCFFKKNVYIYIYILYYIYIYIYICVYYIYIYVMYIYIYICLIYTYVLYIYIHMCVSYIYIYIYIYTGVCLIHTYVCIIYKYMCIYICVCDFMIFIHISWKVMWIVGKTWVHDGKWWKLDKKMEYDDIMESCFRKFQGEDQRSRRVLWTGKLWASRHTSAISGPIDTMQTFYLLCIKFLLIIGHGA